MDFATAKGDTQVKIPIQLTVPVRHGKTYTSLTSQRFQLEQ